jgi:hypothetical protein
MSTVPGEGTVKAWCPKCHDAYESEVDLDGAFFGPDVPAMYLKVGSIPLRFQAKSRFLDGYEWEGAHVPKIEQRLYRWAEIRPGQ